MDDRLIYEGKRDNDPGSDCEMFTPKSDDFYKYRDPCGSDGHYMCNYCHHFDIELTIEWREDDRSI